MKKVCLILVLSLLPIISLKAVLSPFYQSVTEIETILKDPNIADTLGSGQQIKNTVNVPVNIVGKFV